MKITRFLQLSFLILLAAGAQPAYSAFWQWSKTAATNAGADPSINWAEGMSPSSINDSARAMMARAAEFRDDTSGLLTTGGTSSAYTVTTNQGLNPGGAVPTPSDGQLLSFTVHATNAPGATLQADGGTAYPIQSSPGVAIPSGTLILGSPYSAKFSVANSAWMLKGFYGSTLNVPLGALVPYTLTSAPSSNFVMAAGQCISTATYATYWNALGNPASGSCAGGQFRIIDLSGRAAVGLDTMPGFSAANRLTSSASGCGTAMTSVGAACANGLESITQTLAQVPAGITSAQNGIAFSAVTTSGLKYVGAPNWTTSGTCCTGGTQNTGQSTNTLTVGDITVNGTLNVAATSNNTSGQPMPNVMPAVGVTYLLRVL